ncbi:FAD synthase [Drosophila teissieri]|uniref:FAD synthase n=1 Tax=Drosophila teissieri TaxID=7243 RepID=UPI001CBA46E8|nr:FAD synthase [Drosophila teissieri]
MKLASQFWHKVCRHYHASRGLYVPTVEKSESNDQLRHKLEHSEEVIKRAMTLYKPNEMMLSFNGGKDCTVLLDILARMTSLTTSMPLGAVYVKSANPFEELETFVDNSVQRYGLQLRIYQGALKVAFEQLIAEDSQVKAIFLGCRRSDPEGFDLCDMAPTNNGWPAMMRIFPLLEWSYHDIWSYLRSNNLPYCCLYDRGYTSLGDRSSTRLNPNLLSYDEKLGKMTYRPAYELEDVLLERINRDGHGQVSVSGTKQ